MYSLRTSIALVSSGVVHTSLLVALVSKDPAIYLPVNTFAPMEVVDIPPPPPPPPPPALPELPPPAPQPETQVRPLKPTPATSKPSVAKEPQALAPVAPQPVALAGVSLSNMGLAMASGSGSGFAPTTRAAQVQPPPAPVAAPRASSSPTLTSLADLSRKPSPPVLNGALARNYPPHLRASGTEGQALVRVIVGSTGEVRTTTLLSETHGGFGSACQKALQGSQWDPPIDQLGRPTATSLQYRCRFTVGL